MKINETDKPWCWKANQSWHYVMNAHVIRVDKCPLQIRATVERNAYDHQSSVIGELLTINGWKRIASFPMTKDRHCYIVSYVADSIDQSLMEDDAKEMLAHVSDLVKDL
jgi:hypothetical protein